MKKIILSILAVFAFVNISYSQYFTKVTTGQFVNDGGASRSVNMIDYDNDGDLDIYVTHGPAGGQNNCLYKNNGTGTFTKVTDIVIVQDGRRSDGSSWADIDNDGDLDLCFVNWSGAGNNLYTNNGNGTFTFLNTSPVSATGGYSETCSWGDYDNDGLVDLFVTNSAGSGRRNFLFKNTGSTNFVRIDTSIVNEIGISRGVNWVDIDNDNDLDLFVANEESQRCFLYKNNGAGYFTKVNGTPITAELGNHWSGSWGDYDNDGDLDLFSTFWGGVNSLYRNDGNFTFTKMTGDTLVNDPGYYASSAWADFDNDGDLDIFLTQAYGTPGPNCLYKNLLNETGVFEFQKVANDPSVSDIGYSYGFSWGDLNGDGFVDLYVANTLSENQNNYCYMNNGNNNSRVQIRCVGTASNKAGIGAKIRVKANTWGEPTWQLRVVEGQNGYCAQTLWQSFGLWVATTIDSIVVEWPSGNKSVFTNVAINKSYTITENGGITNVENEFNYNGAPSDFRLEQNYPNPFNPTTNIQFSISKPEFVKLNVYDLTGKLVSSLINENLNAGNYEAKFNGENLSSGVYYYKLESTSFTETKKMMLVK